MAEEVLMYLSFIIVIAAILTIAARIIRQPPIIAYLIAGVLVGPLFLKLIGPGVASSETIQAFAHIGVAFLLFIVGLNLDYRVFKEVGKVSFFAGLTEIILTGVIGFFLALAIGTNNITALYIGAAIAFSSTVVVVKILSDKKEIDTLHGRIALGILIVEDIVAAVALMLIPLVEGGESTFFVIQQLLLVLGLIALVFLCSTFVLSRFLNYLARNQEVLFLFGIGWALTISALFDYLGFSLEIGALIAGMSLASTKYTLELGGKIKPLRDFFVVIFFVFFGSQLATAITMDLLRKAIMFSAFIVIGKPIIVMTILKLFGYKKRTNFLTGSSLAQISEFSLILILLGYNLGHLSQEIISLVVLIAIITIGASSYSIYYAHPIYEKLSRILSIFEGKKKELGVMKEKKYDVILFGYHRMGYKILEAVKKQGLSCIVIDYNPKVILSLSNAGQDCVYGDSADRELLEETGVAKAKMIISTIPDEEINLSIKRWLKEGDSQVPFIATAEQPRAALDLYREGVDYVVIPHHLGGDFVAHLIEKHSISKTKYKQIGKEHHKELLKAKNNSSYM